MGSLGWSDLVALLTSVGFGLVSAVFPVANAETYVIASQVSGVVDAVPIAVGVGLGQSLGKLLLFLGARRGREFSIMRRRPTPDSGSIGPVRTRLRAWGGWLIALVGESRWRVPIVAMAAFVGIPPLYAVALLAGATKMPTVLFAVTVAVGRTGRFVLVAFGVGGLERWLV